MFFFFNDTATTEIYTLSLHDALPISPERLSCRLALTSAIESRARSYAASDRRWYHRVAMASGTSRSEEHTSELQSRQYLVCRLLLEKKKKQTIIKINSITTH